MSSTIVVPLDGSPAAESAIPFARMLAGRQGAPLILASVVSISSEFASWMNTGVKESDRELGVWVEDRRNYLTDLINALGGDAVRAHVSVGRPTSDLVELIDSTDSPMVVMASHGRAEPAQGTVSRRTLRLIQNLGCPVVVVRSVEGGHTRPNPDITRVVVPHDGSAFSEAALDVTTTLLGEPLPSIHLVHVIDDESAGGEVARQGLVGDYFEAVRDARTERLQQMAAHLSYRGFTTTWEVREGEPTEQITLSATDANASMIAMSTHGRSGIAHALLGSVAEGVLYTTQLPLLLIRPGDND